MQGNAEVFNRDGKLHYRKSGEDNEIFYNTLTTGRGQTYTTVLSDGSQVWLNAASSIRFPSSFVYGEREVEVTGEAYFEVAHNKNAPFIVSTGKQKITVLGTRFNVNAYADEQAIRTTLVEGSVKVTSNNADAVLNPANKAF